MDTVYSYIRFSSKKQGGGRSIRRQEELRDAWAKKMGVTLDTSLKADKGVSSFKGKHRSDKHNLGKFLELVRRGDVAKGSYLIVESLDRLTREEVIDALSLLLDLIKAGVRVVQLQPVETVFERGCNPMLLMMAIVELSRGHSESVMKSERQLDAWKGMREAARGLVPFHSGKRCPAWLRVEGGKLVPIPERAAAVKRVFHLAAAGYGQYATVRKLNAEGVPPIVDPVYRLDDDGQETAVLAKGVRWTRSYVALLLRDRRVLGECQLHTGGKAEGDPIAGYFPAIIEEGLFARAQAASRVRRGKGGRPPKDKRVNIFSGLLYDARDGGRLHVACSGGRTGPILRSYNTNDGLIGFTSFPLEPFEVCITAFLGKVEMPPEEDAAADRARILREEMARTEKSIAAIGEDLDENGDSPELLKRLREKGERKRELEEQLAEAERRASRPAAWGEMQSLVSYLDTEERRRRLRAAIQEVVESIHCHFIPLSRSKVAIVQVFFRGTNESVFHALLYTPATKDRIANIESMYVAEADTSAFDLRNGTGVKELVEKAKARWSL
jgi:DNA invertase Pin-like site-specific DNA recombinase